LQRGEVDDLLHEELAVGLVVDEHPVECDSASEDFLLPRRGIGMLAAQLPYGGVIVVGGRPILGTLECPLMEVSD